MSSKRTEKENMTSTRANEALLSPTQREMESITDVSARKSSSQKLKGRRGSSSIKDGQRGSQSKERDGKRRGSQKDVKSGRMSSSKQGQRGSQSKGRDGGKTDGKRRGDQEDEHSGDENEQRTDGAESSGSTSRKRRGGQEDENSGDKNEQRTDGAESSGLTSRGQDGGGKTVYEERSQDAGVDLDNTQAENENIALIDNAQTDTEANSGKESTRTERKEYSVSQMDSKDYGGIMKSKDGAEGKGKKEMAFASNLTTDESDKKKGEIEGGDDSEEYLSGAVSYEDAYSSRSNMLGQGKGMWTESFSGQVGPMECPRESAVQYLSKHKINDLFDKFLIALIREKPDNPAEFLYEMAREINRQRRQILNSNSTICPCDEVCCVHLPD